MVRQLLVLVLSPMVCLAAQTISNTPVELEISASPPKPPAHEQ